MSNFEYSIPKMTMSIIEQLKAKNAALCVVGMGYVGLPLILEFAKHFKTIGFDIDSELIENLQSGQDPRGEVDNIQFNDVDVTFTDKQSDLNQIKVWIVAVPTPVTRLNSPDIRPLKKASTMIAEMMSEGSLVIYESTVYPGCTEEDCLSTLQSVSSLSYPGQFNIGYSPERINPGDKVHTLTNTVKIVSGDSPETLDLVTQLYETIIIAGVHKAPTIKVAEAAKIIENTQRDLNIAFMNEMSIIFDLMDIKTTDVLAAAETKWNFLKFYPGLVGGHCIGVDPYYLTHKAESLGYKPEIVLSGRKVNDNLSKHVVKKILLHFGKYDISTELSRILVLGIAFKENVSDIRNSKVVDVVHELVHYNIEVEIYDPYVDSDELQAEYQLSTVSSIGADYDCVIIANKHKEFLTYDKAFFASIMKEDAILIDVKSVYTDSFSKHYWSL